MNPSRDFRGLPIGAALTFSHTPGGRSVGTTAVKLLDADPFRIAVTITNGSTNIAYIGVDKNVGSTNGIALDQYAYGRTINDDTHPGLAGQELWVISSAAATPIGYIATRLIE